MCSNVSEVVLMLILFCLFWTCTMMTQNAEWTMSYFYSLMCFLILQLNAAGHLTVIQAHVQLHVVHVPLDLKAPTVTQVSTKHT